MHAFALKDYQIKVLENIDIYLKTVKHELSEVQDYYDFQIAKGKDAPNPLKSNYLHDAWENIKAKIAIPLGYDIKTKRQISTQWKHRIDGLGYKIPNISLKVPTGGGKTLLAVESLKRIVQDYQGKSTGLVLWITPTDSIFKQTLKAFCNREHPYRMGLDKISGGRTKILERTDGFTPQDVTDNLCVMILTLQSFNIGKNKKDARKIFGDSGRYENFFPPIDDYTQNDILLNTIPNLVQDDMLERNVIDGLYIKHSLGNVFKILKPIVVIDEEHKAKSDKAIDNINDFNPAFILELSATPRDNSNKLVDVSGSDLKDEEMIKLPINLNNYSSDDWKDTLNHAVEKHKELQKIALEYHAKSGVYIRPIMVIIAEDNKKDTDQAEQIKRYLIDKNQILEDSIKKKLSNNDELKNINLADPLCPVDYIITKDALKEGWDCPFAYTLTILANRESHNDLTQYIGRVLRQPYAKRTCIEDLNQCYIFCHFKNVTDTIQAIKKGLEEEGMGDISNNIITNNDNDIKIPPKKVTQYRQNAFKNNAIFLPQLNSIIDGTPQKFDYYRDILDKIDWTHYAVNIDVIPLRDDTQTVEKAKFDYNKNKEIDLLDAIQNKITPISKELDFSIMVNQLTEKIQNPFVASKIIDDVIHAYHKKGVSDTTIALNSAYIISEIKKNAFAWLIEQSEAIFMNAIKNRTIILKLLSTPYEHLNWILDEQKQITISENALEDKFLSNNIFQPQYKDLYNATLEYPVAQYINTHEAVKWWHRLSIKGTEYAVQGWKKDKIYPDFLIQKTDDSFVFIETKGNQLKGNDDTLYKNKVLECLSKANFIKMGNFELMDEQNNISFNLVYQDDWETSIREII